MTVVAPPDRGPARLAADVWWASRRPGAARALVFDVDGTLAPITTRAEDARVPDATLAALERLIDAGWRLAIVSGRAALQVRALVPLDRAAVFGSHGVENPGGLVPPGVDLPRAAARLDSIARKADAFANVVPDVRVEHKPFGLAFHDRALSDADLALWRRHLRSWLAEQRLDGLEIVDGKRVCEVRPTGVHKGSIVSIWEPARSAFPGDRSLVAAGDDRPDEDLFAALGDTGLTIHVGAGDAPSLARHRLGSPDEVGLFLEELSSWSERGDHA